MSIAILNDVYSELRRLAIAGSVVAPGDFRLKKLIEPLKISGDKAPIFNRVAECVEQVVNSTEKTAPSALLELGSLVGSILHTQGSTGIEGKLESLPASPMTMQRTQTSARMLKPLMEALTTTGSGRFEQIKSAHEMNLFNDLRLVRPALQAIDDSYAEIRDYVADKILPIYGRAILDELLATFDVKGKAGHGRRLKVIHKIAPAEARELVKRALDEGSKEVKLVAIECLGDSDDDLSYLLEQASARAKEVRAAALLSLSRLNAAEANAMLIKALDTKDIDLLIPAAQAVASPELIDGAFDRIVQDLAALLNLKDKAKQKTAVERLLSLLQIATSQLNGRSEKLLMEMFENSETLSAIKSDPGGGDLVEFAANRLSDGSDGAVKYLIKQRDQVPSDCWYKLLQGARKSLSSADFFKIFSEYLEPKAKKKSPAEGRSETLVNLLVDRQHYYYFDLDPNDDTKLPPLDAKWLDLAIKLDLPELVCALAKLKNASLHKYLSTKWDACSGQKRRESWQFVLAMLQSEHPDAEQIILNQVNADKDGKRNYYYGSIWARLCGRLSQSAIPELEAIIADPKTNDRLGSELLEAIQTIRENATIPN